MAKRLNPEIINILKERLGKTPSQIRPRLSEIRREHSALTLNAAAQQYAQQHGVSILSKLDGEDRETLASVQSISRISTSKTVKIDKRTLNITNSPIHNLSFGDRSNVNQSVVSLDGLLAELFKKIEESVELPPDQKNDYKSDIQSLASQIGKKSPIRQIVKTAWDSIKGLADIEGFAQLITRATPLIQAIISAHGHH